MPLHSSSGSIDTFFGVLVAVLPLTLVSYVFSRVCAGHAEGPKERVTARHGGKLLPVIGTVLRPVDDELRIRGEVQSRREIPGCPRPPAPGFFPERDLRARPNVRIPITGAGRC
uniref:Uncharacterized protein n=1 Tax=Zea mays TaxID=4577 RepID=A0A804NS15_MAIZE